MFPDFGLPPDIIGSTLNGLGVEEVYGLEVGDGEGDNSKEDGCCEGDEEARRGRADKTHGGQPLEGRE